MRTTLLQPPLSAVLPACLLGAALASAAWPALALAADGENTPLALEAAPVKAAESAGGGSGVLRTIAGLVIVIAVIYAVTWVLKAVKRANEAQATGTALQDVATLSLGGNRSLHLVRAGDVVVLLGAGEGGITHIRSYHQQEARELGLLADDALTQAPDGLAGAAGAVLTTVAGGPPAVTPAVSRASRTLDALRRRTVIR